MTVINLKIVLKIILVLPLCMPAQHKIESYVISNGAGSSSNSSTQMQSTVGQPMISSSGNTNYNVSSGFWGGISKLLTNVAENEMDIIPKEMRLYQNYPNPFNPSTKIKFGIPRVSKVSLAVYNILGEVVSEIFNKELNPGYYEIEYNNSHLSSGIYFYTIKSERFVETKKMIMLK